MQLFTIALYGIGAAAVASLFVGAAMKGIHVYQTRKKQY
jgi:hypothetical protein